MSAAGGPTLATLGIKVENGEVVKATTSLNSMTVAGAKTEAATQRLTRRMALAEIEARNMDAALGASTGKMLALSVAAASAAIALGGMIGHKIYEESVQAQAAMAQLEAVVKSTGGAAGLTVKQLDDLSIALQRQTTFSDEAIKGAESLLLTFTHIRGDQFVAATRAVTDLATAMGGDLKGAAIQVGKALEDPERGITALRRSGVSFSNAQQELIKRLNDTGHAAEAQTVILKELEHQFDGSAKAARDTLGGAVEGLKNAWGDLFEVSRGGSNGMVNAINLIADALPKARAAIEQFITNTVVGFNNMEAAAKKFWAYLSIGNGADLYNRLATIEAEKTAANEFAKSNAVVVEGTVKRIAATHELTDAQQKAQEAAQKADAASVKRIATMQADLDAARAMAIAVRQGQGAVDHLTIAQAGERAVREAAIGTSKTHLAQLRALAEATAGLSIEDRKHAEGIERVNAALAAGVAAYEKEKAAAQARSDVIAETDAAVIQTVTEGVQAIAVIRKGVTEDTTVQMANLARDMQTHLSDAFSNIFTKGISSFRDLFGSIRDMFLRMVADMLAASAMKKLAGVMAGLLGNLAPSAAGAQGLGGVAGGIGGAKGLGAGLAGFGVGMGIGGMTGGNVALGALGGAAGGAATGFAVGGPPGAAIGAIAGFVGGIIGAGKAAKEAAAHMAELQKALAASIAGIRAEIAGDSLGAAIASEKAKFDTLRKQTEDAYAGGGAGSDQVRKRNTVLAELNSLEAQRVAQLREAAALQLAQLQQDIQVQILRNTGRTEDADALATQIEQERRLAALRKQGVDDATLAALKESEAVKAQADKAAVEAAKKIEDAAKAAQQAAEAAEKAFNQARATEDLNVELLRAKGQGGAADDLAFQLEQQRRLDDAQKTQSQAFIDKLLQLQQLQRDQRAAQQLIDSTGTGAARLSGAAQAVTAVSSSVSDRTALMLVDLDRARNGLLERIERNTRAGSASGGGVRVENRFTFTAAITEAQFREITARILDEVDSEMASRSQTSTIRNGSVGRG